MFGLPAVQRKSAGLWRNPLAFPAGRAPGRDSNHLCSGGALFSAVTLGTTVYDLIANQSAAIPGTPTFGISAGLGPYVKPNGTNYPNFSGRSTAVLPNVTIAGICLWTAVGTVFGTGAGVGGGGYGIRAIASSHFMLTYNNNIHYSDPSLIISLNAPYFFFASLNTSTGMLNYVVRNLATGVALSAQVTGATTVASASNGTYAFGNDGSNNGGTAQVAAIYVSSQSFSMQHGLAWAADPWSFWYPDTTQFDYAARAAALYALAGASAAYTMGAQAASLVAKRRLSGSPGAFADTASPASVSVTRRVAASPAAFVDSARAATPTALRRLPVAPAAFADNAGVATVRAGRKLPAIGASFSDTPSPAAVFSLRRFPAAPAAFAFTSGAAISRFNRMFPAAAASFAFGAVAAATKASRRLSASFGAFVLSGTASALGYGRIMSASPGAFATTGASITVTLSHVERAFPDPAWTVRAATSVTFALAQAASTNAFAQPSSTNVKAH